MVFWIFMLIMELLLPFTMIGFGLLFVKSPPKEINSFFGYRTRRSKLNKDTWIYAHHYAGKLWYKSGLVTLFITIAIMLMLLGQSIETISLFGLILCLAQCLPLVGVIYPTERALKKNFDEYGNRK